MGGDRMPDGMPFGRYRLIDLVGRGGMGEVWRAYDTVTERVLAIKVLPAHLAQDSDYAARFRRVGFAAEPGRIVGVLSQMSGQHLDGHDALGGGVVGAPHLTHPAATDQVDQAVAPERRSV